MSGRYRRGIGVIGGLGPAAGAYFYRCLVEAVQGADDQDHPHVVLISDPAIPSRLRHLSDGGPDPTTALRDVARRLEDSGCGLLVLTSITTHTYYEPIAAAVRVPVLDGRTAVATALRASGVLRPALAVTSAARSLRLLEPALHAAGITPVYPDQVSQKGIDAVVEGVKSGWEAGEAASLLEANLNQDWARGSDRVLIGCTDLALLAGHLTTPALDVARILADAALEVAA